MVLGHREPMWLPCYHEQRNVFCYLLVRQGGSGGVSSVKCPTLSPYPIYPPVRQHQVCIRFFDFIHVEVTSCSLSPCQMWCTLSSLVARKRSREPRGIYFQLRSPRRRQRVPQRVPQRVLLVATFASNENSQHNACFL